MTAPRKPHRPTEADYRRLDKWPVKLRISAAHREAFRWMASATGSTMSEIVEYWVDTYPVEKKIRK